MKTNLFLFLPAMLALTFRWAPAQTNAAPAPAPKPHVIDVPQPEQPKPGAVAGSSDNLDPAKVAEYQKRFHQGLTLEAQGHLKEARDIYDGILAEQPDARGSLLQAGQVSMQLGELAKADEYLGKLRKVVTDEELEKLHERTPQFPDVIDELIQINQALKHDVKVALLLRDFRDLHDSGKIPGFSDSPCFVRERIHLDADNEIVVSQFFDYMRDPNTVWMAEVFGSNGLLKRRLLLNYDPDATKALRAKDAKYASTQVFIWLEHVIANQRVTAINEYLQIFALPDYAKFRSAMLIILTNPPKPIYSAPVNVPLDSSTSDPTH
jgi:tetratricopeptide (TPR) repeat protein